jgi:hypothetical protein
VAHSGQWVAWIGGASGTQFVLEQVVILPAGRPAYIHFYSLTEAQDPCDVMPDRVIFKVDNIQITEQELCSGYNSGWDERVFQLSAFAGQTVTFRIEGLRNSQSGLNSMFLDDFTLEEAP